MSESFLGWDPAQVAQYFSEEVGEDLTTSFIEHNIDGSLLPFLTTGHLKELGIESLSSRLFLKSKINELLASQYASGLPKSLRAEDLYLKSIDINSNYVSIEALSLCSDLLKDMSLTTRRVMDDTINIKKLNENFKKLKLDLNPVIRLMKDSKPLPTPTLDPGISVSSPTHSTSSILSTHSWSASDSEGGNTPTTTTTLILPGASSSKPGSSPQNTGHPSSALPSPTASLFAGSANTSKAPPSKTSPGAFAAKPSSSPTHSNRYSSASVLSVGVGKVTDVKVGTSSRIPPKPRLVDTKTPSSSVEDLHEAHKLSQRQEAENRSILARGKASSTSLTSGAPSGPTGQSNQPLKQLKASSDDTCLKVLQHAMKRHHIPREKWSKYVLVVCYGDKERILKLTEKPVGIFKDLQEHGQNPTIMLRERASTSENDLDYENSRIGDDIPGGRL